MCVYICTLLCIYVYTHSHTPTPANLHTYRDTRESSAVNLDELVASGVVSATFSKGTISQRLKYLAHALDYRDTLDTAITHTPT